MSLILAQKITIYLIDERETNGGVLEEVWGVGHNTTGNIGLYASGWKFDGTDPDITDNQWHHLAWVYTATGNLEMFVDGDSVHNDATIAGSNLITWEGLDTIDDVLQKIIYNADRSNITRVWVQGRAVRG